MMTAYIAGVLTTLIVVFLALNRDKEKSELKRMDDKLF